MPSFLVYIYVTRPNIQTPIETWQWAEAETGDAAVDKVRDNLLDAGYEDIQVQLQLDMFREYLND